MPTLPIVLILDPTIETTFAKEFYVDVGYQPTLDAACEQVFYDLPKQPQTEPKHEPELTVVSTQAAVSSVDAFDKWNAEAIVHNASLPPPSPLPTRTYTREEVAQIQAEMADPVGTAKRKAKAKADQARAEWKLAILNRKEMLAVHDRLVHEAHERFKEAKVDL